LFKSGTIKKSLRGIFYLGGSTTRTPGNYYRADPDTGQPTSKPLRQTNEYVHPSVRSRFLLDGLGIDDRGFYEATALQSHKLKIDDGDSSGGRPLAIWVPRSRQSGAIRLPESPLWEIEKELLRTDPDMYDYILQDPKPPNRRDP
jgi:hypothetical protein